MNTTLIEICERTEMHIPWGCTSKGVTFCQCCQKYFWKIATFFVKSCHLLNKLWLQKTSPSLHSGKLYVMRVGKNLLKYSDLKNLYVIWIVNSTRSSIRIFICLCFPVLYLHPEIRNCHIWQTLAQVPERSWVRNRQEAMNENQCCVRTVTIVVYTMF